jgi:hypothetical protein
MIDAVWLTQFDGTRWIVRCGASEIMLHSFAAAHAEATALAEQHGVQVWIDDGASVLVQRDGEKPRRLWTYAPGEII